MAEIDGKKILEKIEKTEKPQVKKAALAYSGGMDSTLGVEFLRRVYKAKEIIAITLDVGQGDEELKESDRKAKLLNIKPIVVDVKDEFTEVWLRKAIQANSNYNGYPVATSMTRQLVAGVVAREAAKQGCDAILEGCTGKGNDQYRMHNVIKYFAPEIEILQPVRDFDLTRYEEEFLVKEWNVPISEQITGGDDKTMWCRSIASGAVDLNQPLPDDIWMWLVPPEKAPDKAELIDIEFKNGVPVSLNGKQMKLGDLVMKLNVIAGRNGIGKIDMFEDGIMNMKSREIYEAPAATLILKLHGDLEQWCLTKDEIQFKKTTDAKWAYLVYHGEWYHPLKEDIDAFNAKSQEYVNGKYTIKLYKGNAEIMKRESDTGLFNQEMRSIKSRGFDQRWAIGSTKVSTLQWMILAKAGRTPKSGEAKNERPGKK
ncbi:MAG: argininosuccinate synthase [Candidatus Altiarchaeota archaeon]|nr:argininosuccinate synthase [Candidatus Altiarchaeota archaeon]